MTASQQKRKRNLSKENNLSSLLWPAVIIVLVIALDQITKYWAVTYLTGQPPVKILGEFFMFTLVYNRGGAMGISIGPSGYYLIVTFILLPVLIWYMFRVRHIRQTSIPLSFIIAGAFGNLIDRLRIDKVVDFIDVDFFDIPWINLTRWWTFNIADACISVALLYLLINSFRPPGQTIDQDARASSVDSSEAIT